MLRQLSSRMTGRMSAILSLPIWGGDVRADIHDGDRSGAAPRPVGKNCADRRRCVPRMQISLSAVRVGAGFEQVSGLARLSLDNVE
jgi:hypothetical protein